MRIAPNIIVNQDPELYRVIMAPRSPFIRGQWFEGMKLDPRIDNIVSMTDEKAHAELRTKLMPGVSLRRRFFDRVLADWPLVYRKRCHNPGVRY